MKQVRCPNCGFFCQKYGKTRYDSQRWHCKQCKFTFTNSYDKTVQSFQSFLTWLFSKGDAKGDGWSRSLFSETYCYVLGILGIAT